MPKNKTSTTEAMNALSCEPHNEVHPTGPRRNDLVTVMKGHHVKHDTIGFRASECAGIRK